MISHNGSNHVFFLLHNLPQIRQVGPSFRKKKDNWLDCRTVGWLLLITYMMVERNKDKDSGNDDNSDNK